MVMGTVGGAGVLVTTAHGTLEWEEKKAQPPSWNAREVQNSKFKSDFAGHYYGIFVKRTEFDLYLNYLGMWSRACICNFAQVWK
jgi:hypothetical protein